MPCSVDIAIVVITYNSAHMIGGLLDSIPAALGEARGEVVVVDNGSDDGTSTIVNMRDDCRLIQQSNRGYSAGLNRGVAELPEAAAVLVLNPDVRLEPRSVEIMMATLRDQRAAVVAPQVRNEDGSLFRSLRREPSLGRALGFGFTGRQRLSEHIADRREYNSRRCVDWALGAALLLERDCYEKLGGWDESFFLYSEETDYCLRVRDLGRTTIYEPAAVVMHIGGQSGQSDRLHVMQIVNRVRLFNRRHGRIAGWGYYLLALLSELSWVVRGKKRSISSVEALLRPSMRPIELDASGSLLPR